MKVKITPIGESSQIIEFNVSLPCGARASVAPDGKVAAENLLATIRKSIYNHR